MTGNINFTIGGESHETKIDSWQRSNVSPSIELTVERTMTTKDKALALVKRLRIIPDQNGLMYEDYEDVVQAADLIEQHEAFRQEVSDAVEELRDTCYVVKPWRDRLAQFIIHEPKPDPLVAALEGVTFDHYPPNDAKTIRAALDAIGFEIREKNDG